MNNDNPGVLRQRAGCPSCGTPTFRQIARESFGDEALRGYLANYYQGRARIDALTDFYFELVRCTSCTLAYQRWIPSDTLLADIYERWILPSEKDKLRQERSLDDYCYMAEQVQFIVRHFRARPCDLRILDFGMGWAEWADMARSFGCDVAGAELSVHRIKHARTLGIAVIDWLDIPNHKFNFINTEQVFEHLTEPQLVLAYLVKALSKDGVIRISVPDSRATLRLFAGHGSFARLSEKDQIPVAPLEHINSFEYRSLLNLAIRAGLSPIRPRIRDLYNSSSGWLNARNALRLGLRPWYRHVFPKSTIMYFGR